MTERITPARRPVSERIHDWKEFYRPMDEKTLQSQASRCLDCGVPFCHGPQGCPVENLIPDWNDLVRQGRWKEALKALHATNNFPEFTGKLCPAPCESACVLGIHSDAVTIRTVESNIIDRGFEEGWVQPILAKIQTGKKIAVIGSGPAGLAAAQQLARQGHSVTVFEKADQIGGLLRYGIPEFKMEKWVLDRRLAQLMAEGVEFRTGVNVGGTLDAQKLLAEFDALCLTIGAEKPRDLAVPGREFQGIHFAMEYLLAREESITAHEKRVLIIGGGDTGSDCLGTAHRQGAREVHQWEILPRPPEKRDASTPWPNWPLQLRTSHAHEEGGIRDWSVATLGFEGSDGRVTKVRAQHMGSSEGIEMPVDLVLLAMGFSGPVRSGLIENLSLKLDARGGIAVDPSFQTNVPAVFAAGDAKRGASLIVWAIAEGRKMAAAVDHFLMRNPSQENGQ
ncbi:MAG: glutamate synthase subunit beta [Bdellovibrionota bacterium]